MLGAGIVRLVNTNVESFSFSLVHQISSKTLKMTWLTIRFKFLFFGFFLFGKWIQPGRSWSRICWSLWRLPRMSGATDARVTETESKGPGSEPAPGVSEFSFSASRVRIPTSCRTCRWRGRLAWQGHRLGYGRPPRWSWRAPSSSFRTMRSCEK